MRIRLHYTTVADFRKNEVTNFGELPAPIRKTMKQGDAICFRNTAGTQVMFVYKPKTRDRGDGVEAGISASTRLRLERYRAWDPAMLSEYAAELGLELIGLKRLHELLGKNGA